MADPDKNKVIQEYLQEIQTIFRSGDAREHAYRPAFQKLIQQLKPEIQVINEPAYTGGNAPDFLFKKGDTPIAYAECKDVTVDIGHKDVQKQANRYVEAFGKILLTNYYDFQILDEDGEIVSISIAEREDQGFKIIPDHFQQFANIIYDYITPSSRTIRSAKKLAEIMASKARILRDNALASLEQNQNSDIYAQYKTFKEVLIRELSEAEFADMYAQTLVYGLFVARYHDPTIPTFSRHEAQDLLPASNPLLKKFFGHVAGTDYDPKIAWLVDSLIEAYLSTNVYELMHKEFVKKQKDPVLHFYETFLAAYDKDLRKSRGVYYTPEPVVSFIVRSVDQILKTKFSLPKGLADISLIEHQEKLQADDGRRKDGVKRKTNRIHKVQVLDPAVGTGTFLNEVINEIYKKFKGQEGMWPTYVKEHLLPRIHGFELMMASYTMAHLKLGVTLAEQGYKGDDRLSIWLTNSLEESVHEVPNLFMSQWLTEESHHASKIKSETPVMVVIGNPPYSGSSFNKGKWITNLVEEYKDAHEKQRMGRRWMQDDYVKFIALAESQINKTGEGILGFITPHGFIDNPTFRGMRLHLLNSFDEIYILDLHGNGNKKEKAPDGGKDENVFDIKQGVSIMFGVKYKSPSKKLADVYHHELFGNRKKKYVELLDLDFLSTTWKEVGCQKPDFFFVPTDYESVKNYGSGFKVGDLFRIHSSGIVTGIDRLAIFLSEKEMSNTIKSVLSCEDPYAAYKIVDSLQATKEERLAELEFAFQEGAVPINYRPFDYRFTLRFKKTHGMINSPRPEVMSNFILGDNLGIILPKQNKNDWGVNVTNAISGHKTVSAYDINYVFPLYLYHDDGTKTPNLEQTIWNKINEIAGQAEPEDILDYIYAILHSPSYREKYKEFLKIDFPQVPYPKNKMNFKKLVGLGRELRNLHLLESEKVNQLITTFPVGGTNIVGKQYPKYDSGKVYLNDTQYFGSVPEGAWDFYIGGYQPAQKWLKDRRERELSMEDIEHYQKMIVSMSETIKIMGKIDQVIDV